MTDLDPNVDVPEVEGGQPVDEEPEGWELLERLKELEADFDRQVTDLKERIDELEARVTELESNQSD